MLGIFSCGAASKAVRLAAYVFSLGTLCTGEVKWGPKDSPDAVSLRLGSRTPGGVVCRVRLSSGEHRFGFASNDQCHYLLADGRAFKRPTYEILTGEAVLAGGFPNAAVRVSDGLLMCAAAQVDWPSLKMGTVEAGGSVCRCASTRAADNLGTDWWYVADADAFASERAEAAKAHNVRAREIRRREAEANAAARAAASAPTAEQATGRNVTRVAFGRGPDTLEEVASGRWMQFPPSHRSQPDEHFLETGRDDWSVYLAHYMTAGSPDGMSSNWVT